MNETGISHEKFFPRRIKRNDTYATIFDPRIKNYPPTHELQRALTPLGADFGVEWITVPLKCEEETIALLDKYPVTPQETSEV